MAIHQIKIGTYNVENFYDRFDDPYSYTDDLWGARTTKPKKLDEIYNLGERLRQDKPDVMAFQEVENKGALHEFNIEHLGGQFRDIVVVEGNDPRGIQVGVASRFPLGQVVSYQFLRDIQDRRKGKIFSRDLLEVEILDPDNFTYLFTMFVSHLKSKFVDPSLKGEKREAAQQRATQRRTRQAMAMAQLIKRRFYDPQQAYYVVTGDFNDTPDAPALQPLLNNPELNLYDVLQSVPPDDRWTHYWSAAKEHSQIDYILLSPMLRSRMVNGSAHVIHRSNSTGSDHKPVYVSLRVGWD